MNYRIVTAGPDHIERLPAIERAAAEMFSTTDLPSALRVQTTPLTRLRQAQQLGRLWVALDAQDLPVGSALVTQPGRHAHLQQLDVHPNHGRQGLGTKLVRTVLVWAQRQGNSGVTLTTFRHVPWNAPFYQKLGFTVLVDEQLAAEPVLSQLLLSEAHDGLCNRIAMRYELSAEPAGFTK